MRDTNIPAGPSFSIEKSSFGCVNHAAKADSKPKKLKVQPALLLQGQLGGKQQQVRLEVIETNAVIELLLLMAEILHQFIGSLSHYF